MQVLNGMPGRYVASPSDLVDKAPTALLTDIKGRLVLSPGASSGLTYNSTPPTLANLGTTGLQGDINGNLKVTLATKIRGEDFTADLLGVAIKPVAGSQYGYTPKFGFTATTYQTVKAAAGTLRSVIASNANAGLRYLQFFNTAGAPSGATGILASIPIPAGSAAAPGMLMVPAGFLDNMYFSTGVCVAISTADGTFTAATAGDHTVNTWSL